MQEIQTKNGELGCHRYIISNNQTAQNIFEVFAMIRLSNWEEPTVDVAPLFETITDLSIAPKVMDIVYSNPTYRNHLRTRGDKQTIMLGFSDGTKDGGYLMANWSIFRAKEELPKFPESMGLRPCSLTVGVDHQHVAVETHISFMHRWEIASSRMRFKSPFKDKRSVRTLGRSTLASTTSNNF